MHKFTECLKLKGLKVEEHLGQAGDTMEESEEQLNRL